MLKFTNPERTAAQFNNVSFSLTSAENWQSIGDAPTREAVLAYLEEGNIAQAVNVASADDMWQRIKAERDRRSTLGGYKVGTKWFHSDSDSKIKQLGLVMAGAGLPLNLQWKTMDGSFITMTPTLAVQVFQAAIGNDMAIFTAAETHKATMQASATPHTYNYLTGWPAVFGG